MLLYAQAVEMEAAELEGADEDEGDEVDLVGQRLEHEVRCKNCRCDSHAHSYMQD